MTVSSASLRNDYVGNNSTDTYNYNFRIQHQSHLRVTKQDTNGVVTELALTTDYTVTGVGLFAGGSITLVAGNLPTNYLLTIRPKVPGTQLTDLRNRGGFFPDVHEDVFDLLATMDLQQQDVIDRSIKFPETDGVSLNTTLPPASERANTFLAFDAQGEAMVSVGTTVPVTTFVGTLIDDADAAEFMTTLGISSFAQTLLDDTSALAALRTLTGVGSTDFVTAGGTGDALTATFSPAYTSLTDGLYIRVRAAAANASTTPTLNVNGLGAVTITREGGQALRAGDIGGAGHELILVYRSSAPRWELINPAYARVLSNTDDNSLGDALVGIKRTLTSATASTLHAYNENRRVNLVTDFGAVLNDSSAGARTANRTAFVNALASGAKVIYIPQGAGPLYLPTNADIDVPAGVTIEGESRFSGSTRIRGDGRIFTFTTAGGAEHRAFRNLDIANEVTEGILIQATWTADITSMWFQNVRFGKSTHHVYSTGAYAVAWTFIDCKFENASVISRFIDGSTIYTEHRCYSISNTRGLRLGDNNRSTVGGSIIASVYELHTEEAVSIVANGNNVEGFNFTDAWFEANGSASGAADVLLQTSTANTIRVINFESCQFRGPTGSQLRRVNISASGGGTIDLVSFNHCYVEGAVNLTDDLTSVYLNNTYFASASARDTNKKALYLPNAQSSLTGVLSASTTWDPASTADGAVASATITVTGALTTDCAIAAFSNIGSRNYEICAFVESSNTVRVVLTNRSGGAVDLSSGTLKVMVFKS